jgi:hypothetical protein
VQGWQKASKLAAVATILRCNVPQKVALVVVVLYRVVKVAHLKLRVLQKHWPKGSKSRAVLRSAQLLCSRVSALVLQTHRNPLVLKKRFIAVVK